MTGGAVTAHLFWKRTNNWGTGTMTRDWFSPREHTIASTLAQCRKAHILVLLGQEFHSELTTVFLTFTTFEGAHSAPCINEHSCWVIGRIYWVCMSLGTLNYLLSFQGFFWSKSKNSSQVARWAFSYGFLDLADAAIFYSATKNGRCSK